MKQKIFMVAMIIAALSLPLQINAKGKPASVALLKDANGETVGRVIGMEHASGAYVLTDQGYRTLFFLSRGRVESPLSSVVFYTSTDCLGDAYVGPGGVSLGAVFIPRDATSETAYSAGFIFYTPNDAQGVMIDVNSSLDTSDRNNITCISYPSPVSLTLYPAYLNDPSITGIQNTAYPTRMLIE